MNKIQIIQKEQINIQADLYDFEKNTEYQQLIFTINTKLEKKATAKMYYCGQVFMKCF